MPFGQGQPQEEAAAGNQRDLLAGITTAPRVTPTLTTRPEMGATTSPSALCWAMTDLSACAGRSG